MTVYDFLDMCIDERMLRVEIYDCESDETIFDGDYDDIPSELMDEEVCSFDVPSEIGKITINISKE